MTSKKRMSHAARLHDALDQLVAEWISEEGPEGTRRPSQTTVLELMNWSHARTQFATEPGPFERLLDSLEMPEQSTDQQRAIWAAGVKAMKALDRLRSLASPAGVIFLQLALRTLFEFTKAEIERVELPESN